MQMWEGWLGLNWEEVSFTQLCLICRAEGPLGTFFWVPQGPPNSPHLQVKSRSHTETNIPARRRLSAIYFSRSFFPPKIELFI